MIVSIDLFTSHLKKVFWPNIHFEMTCSVFDTPSWIDRVYVHGVQIKETKTFLKLQQMRNRYFLFFFDRITGDLPFAPATAQYKYLAKAVL
jgi:hypothetical protein